MAVQAAGRGLTTGVLAPASESECDFGPDCVENPQRLDLHKLLPQHSFICSAPAHTLSERLVTAISLFIRTFVKTYGKFSRYFALEKCWMD